MILISAITLCAQQPGEEKFTDINQFFNRTDWRIHKLNELINMTPRPKLNDFRLIKYECDKLKELIQNGAAQFKPEQTEIEVFEKNMASLVDACTELASVADQMKTEQLKPATNALFKCYADFKLSYQMFTVEDMQ